MKTLTKSWMKKVAVATTAVTALSLASAQAAAAVIIIACNSTHCLIIIIH
ncbi:MAG: hypothetical protein HRT53_01475 [Colwellia sp.]|nr:hypothetical protein [Colwellia sp.]